MKEKRAEKLFKYVLQMSERTEEYGVNPSDVIDDLESKDTNVSSVMNKVYSEQISNRYCSECETHKLYDQRKEEYYCPVHDC